MNKTRRVRVPGIEFEIGSGTLAIVAGPCSIESREQLFSTGRFLKENLVHGFRGGVFKMRTHPDSFQGFGLETLKILKEFKQELGLPIFTEITDVRSISDMAEVVDVFQVGSRSMYNYPLLSELGRVGKPILMKRAFSATFDEWMGACAYIEKEGNQQIILCERGVRSFEPRLRNTLDLGMVALIKAETDYPIFVDPSHAAGRRDLVIPLALAAQAVGADGLLVECHPNPDEALSDGPQSLNLDQLRSLVSSLRIKM